MTEVERIKFNLELLHLGQNIAAYQVYDQHGNIIRPLTTEGVIKEAKKLKEFILE